MNKKIINTRAKRFLFYNYALFVASLLFTLFSISFNFDVSLFAFPVSLIMTGFTFYFGFFKILKTKDASKPLVYYKLVQYIPFIMLFAFVLRRAGKNGTSFTYDLFCVILWLLVFIFSSLIAYYMNPKRINNWLVDYKTSKQEKKKYPLGKKILFEAIDWIDALVQAVWLVLLLQIFVLQLYLIPSESMVPSYVIGDRVAVSKINCGPKFPLTQVGLPTFTKYKRGDVVVIRNPHYTIDRKSEVKSVVSQLVYMLSFMTVNLNVDEHGLLKADPLVKRITGVQGEQLVMQDGVLYARTKDNLEFTPVPIDNKYACWNLNEIPNQVKVFVQDFRMSQEENVSMLDYEEERRQFNLQNAKEEANRIIASVNRLCTKTSNAEFTNPSMQINNLFNQFIQIADEVSYNNNALNWFNSFMSSWFNFIDTKMDIYSEANFKMNVMLKIQFGQLVEQACKLISNGNSFNQIYQDQQIQQLFQKVELAAWYINYLLDERNMPVFPENTSSGEPQFIPKDCYFMMGDNRFNSLDLRHSSEPFVRELTIYDANSFLYTSYMKPQYLNKNLIQGKPLIRLWPLSRSGYIMNK